MRVAQLWDSETHEEEQTQHIPDLGLEREREGDLTTRSTMKTITTITPNLYEEAVLDIEIVVLDSESFYA